MKKDPLVFIGHILDSIDIIEVYSAGKSEADLMGSIDLQDKIIRRIEIIGEAVKNLPEVHQYFGVDLEFAWNVVMKDIPELKLKLLKIRDELRRDSQKSIP